MRRVDGVSVHLHACASRADYLELFESLEFQTRWMLETHLANRHRGLDAFALPGFCAACGVAVDFEVSCEGAWHGPDGIVVPNWREHMRCPRCRMNGRQRMIARLVKDAVAASGVSHVYVMEQVTPLFHWIVANFRSLAVTGSEYLNPALPRGTSQGGVQHEDAERLSFQDESVDLFISCDVFEHVNEPAVAFAEIRRVLRRGGRAIVTFPLDVTQERNVRRARVVDGRVQALLPAQYHGNPLSEEGSLVFTDFGWEALEQLRGAGLADVAMMVYWSYELGYLGTQFYLTARRDV